MGVSGSWPPVQRLIDEGKLVPLTLVLSVSKYAMRLVIHKLSLFDKMETDDLNYIYKLHHPTGWTGFFAVVSSRGSVSKQLPLVPRVVFLRHQTRFPLSRAVVIATHWLAEGSARSHWTWLTSHDWVNEAMWQQRLMIWFIIFRGWHFLAPEIAHQLSFFYCGANLSDWSTSSFGSLAVREKHLINQIFIMWLFLLIYAQDARCAPQFVY